MNLITKTNEEDNGIANIAMKTAGAKKSAVLKRFARYPHGTTLPMGDQSKAR